MNKPLKCNGCVTCCQGDAIRKLPRDSNELKWVPHFANPNELMLDHKQNGDCIYLVKDGCSLHGTIKKPQQCREMDCRMVSKKITKNKAKEMGIIKIWKRGNELAKRDRYKL